MTRFAAPERLALMLLAGLAAGCVSSYSEGFPASAPGHDAREAPERFEVVAPASRVAPGDTIAGTGCSSPLVDPRDGTRIRFVRSNAVLADYAVPEGKYGVGADELLRVECNTGRVVGIVRR